MKPLPLSFTILEKHRTCPHQLYRVKVVKDVKEEWNTANDWGNRFHEAVEKFVAHGTPLPDEMKQYQALVDAIPRDTQVEVELAVNKNLKRCKFFDRDVWLRAKVDALRIKNGVARAGDWKTGKNRKVTDQLLINAILIFLLYPEVHTVHVDFFWLQHKAKDSQTYTRDQLPELWAKLLPDIKRYRDDFKNETFPKRPNGLCAGWCPVKDCNFWRPKKEKR
jgi:hypothetical protein